MKMTTRRRGTSPGATIGERAAQGRRPLLTVALVAVALVAVALSASIGCTAWGDAGDEREAERIADLLELVGGEAVADIGAGDGDFTVPLARRVGPTGTVYATEVRDSLLEEITERAEEADLVNVRTVRGDQDGTGLSAGCCDAMLLRKVYHHFTDPAAMNRDMLAALKPGGRLAVVEFTSFLSERVDGVPESRDGHGLPMELLIEEATAAGFELVASYPDWMGQDNQYCVVLRRPRG